MKGLYQRARNAGDCVCEVQQCRQHNLPTLTAHAHTCTRMIHTPNKLVANGSSTRATCFSRRLLACDRAAAKAQTSVIHSYLCGVDTRGELASSYCVAASARGGHCVDQNTQSRGRSTAIGRTEQQANIIMDLLPALHTALDAGFHANSNAFESAKQLLLTLTSSNPSDDRKEMAASTRAPSSKTRRLAEALVVIDTYCHQRSANDVVVVQFICERANEAQTSKALRRGLRLFKWFLLQHPHQAMLEISEYLRRGMTDDAQLYVSLDDRDMMLRHCLELARRALEAFESLLLLDPPIAEQSPEQHQHPVSNGSLTIQQDSLLDSPIADQSQQQHPVSNGSLTIQRDSLLDSQVADQSPEQHPVSNGSLTIQQDSNPEVAKMLPCYMLLRAVLGVISRDAKPDLAIDAANCFVSTFRAASHWTKRYADEDLVRKEWWQACGLLGTFRNTLIRTEAIKTQLHPLFFTALMDLIDLVSENRQSRAAETALTARAMSDNVYVAFAGVSVRQTSVVDAGKFVVCCSIYTCCSRLNLTLFNQFGTHPRHMPSPSVI
jgi:hypothetical protein